MAVLNEREARKARASKHAERTWECPGCRKVCRGNGGQSSHKRACRPYKLYRLAMLEKVVAEIDAGTWGKGLRPSLIERYRHQYAADAERLRVEVAAPKVSLAGEAPGSYQPARDGEPGAPTGEAT